MRIIVLSYGDGHRRRNVKDGRITGHRRAAGPSGDGCGGLRDAPATVVDGRVVASGARGDAPRFASSDVGAAPSAYAVARGGPTPRRVARRTHRGLPGRVD
jgi:hypothetical protein